MFGCRRKWTQDLWVTNWLCEPLDNHHSHNIGGLFLVWVAQDKACTQKEHLGQFISKVGHGFVQSRRLTWGPCSWCRSSARGGRTWRRRRARRCSTSRTSRPDSSRPSEKKCVLLWTASLWLTAITICVALMWVTTTVAFHFSQSFLVFSPKPSLWIEDKILS